MFRFKGGQTVRNGTYWNLRSGESVEVKAEGVLPGGRELRYLRLPPSGVFILGPLAGLLFVCLIPLVSVVAALVLLTRTVSAGDEAGMCMGCHGAPGMVKTFKSGETLSVSLDERHFKDSVHSFLGCTDCHGKVSLDTHPSSVYATVKAFKLEIASACKGCHADDQLMGKPIHARALTRAHAPPCSDCHGSHSIRKVSGLKAKASTSQYCLTCHGQELSISMKGETLSLTVDEKTLRGSVHSGYDCNDCHRDFSLQAHPHEGFGSKRQLSIAVSGACKGCHEEKYNQYRGSIHFSMLSGGNLKAPV